MTQLANTQAAPTPRIVEIKDTTDLRKFLLSEMVATANGLREANMAKAVCNYAQQVYNTINLEMRHAHVKNKCGADGIIPVSLDGASKEEADDVPRLGEHRPNEAATSRT